MYSSFERVKKEYRYIASGCSDEELIQSPFIYIDIENYCRIIIDYLF